MFGLTLIMTVFLGYQIVMPQVNNAKYSFVVDRDGGIIRMNTQNGTMERCDSDLKCGEVK